MNSELTKILESQRDSIYPGARLLLDVEVEALQKAIEDKFILTEKEE
jgi:hypothetical protein